MLPNSSFEDHDGDEVKVEEEHERLQEVRAPNFRAAARAEAKTPERKIAFVDDIDDEDVRFVPASAPVYKPRQRTRLVEAAPAPRQTQYVEVAAVPALAVQPQVEPRLVEVEPAPLPLAEARFVEVEAVPAPVPRRQLEARLVEVEAAPLPLLRSQVETRYVEALPAPPPRLEARFVEVEAPRFKSRKVDLDDDDFRPLLVSRAPPAKPQPLAAVRHSAAAVGRVSARLASRISDSSDEN